MISVRIVNIEFSCIVAEAFNFILLNLLLDSSLIIIDLFIQSFHVSVRGLSFFFMESMLLNIFNLELINIGIKVFIVVLQILIISVELSALSMIFISMQIEIQIFRLVRSGQSLEGFAQVHC